MNVRLIEAARLLGVAFLLVVSVGIFRIGAWLSWPICIALMVIVLMPKERWPFLTFRNRTILVAVLVVLMVSLLSFQWKT